MRAFLYALARLLGDINAVKRGTVGKRVVRESQVVLPAAYWVDCSDRSRVSLAP